MRRHTRSKSRTVEDIPVVSQDDINEQAMKRISRSKSRAGEDIPAVVKEDVDKQVSKRTSRSKSRTLEEPGQGVAYCNDKKTSLHTRSSSAYRQDSDAQDLGNDQVKIVVNQPAEEDELDIAEFFKPRSEIPRSPAVHLGKWNTNLETDSQGAKGDSNLSTSEKNKDRYGSRSKNTVLSKPSQRESLVNEDMGSNDGTSSQRNSLAKDDVLDISEHDEIFKPRTEIPRSPPSNPSSRESSLVEPVMTIADDDDDETVIYNIPKFISLQTETDSKKKKLSAGRKPSNEKAKKEDKNATKSGDKSRKDKTTSKVKPSTTDGGVVEAEIDNAAKGQSENELTKLTDEKQENDSSKDAATKSQSDKEKVNEKREKKAKRGTFVVPGRPKDSETDKPANKTEKAVKSTRRGTFVIPAPPPPKDEQEEEEVEGILNISDGVLIDDIVSETDTKTDTPAVTNGTPNSTIREVQDMELTEALPISQLIGSSYPEPGQVCNEYRAMEQEPSAEESIFKDLTAEKEDYGEVQKVDVPAFVKRSLSLKPDFLEEDDSVAPKEDIKASGDEKSAATTKEESDSGDPSDIESGKKMRKRRKLVADTEKGTKQGKQLSRSKVRRAKTPETETESEREESAERNKASRKRAKEICSDDEPMETESEKSESLDKVKQRSKKVSEEQSTRKAYAEKEADNKSKEEIVISSEEQNQEDLEGDFQCTPQQDDFKVPKLPPIERKEKVRKRVRKPSGVKDRNKDGVAKEEKVASENDEVVEEVPKSQTGQVFKIPAVPPERKKKTKERARKLSSTSDTTEESNAETEPSQRSRSRRRVKDVVQSYAEDTDDDNSVITQETDSEGEKIKKKFNAFVAQPGKITFKAGRTDMADVIAGKTKSSSHSILPRVKSKSKSRSKPRLVPDFMKPAERDPSKPKSVFDLSLNESVTIAPSQTTYTDFKERQGVQSSNAAVPSSVTQLALPKKVAVDGEQSMAESPHGIMLVLGNGKRTKERRPRSKQVRYAGKLEDVHLTTPRHMSDETENDDEKKGFAGATPPRPSKTKEVGDKCETESIPETPPHATPASPSETTPSSPFPSANDSFPVSPVSPPDRKRKKNGEEEDGSPSKRKPPIEEPTKPKSNKLSLNKEKTKVNTVLLCMILVMV